jgi:TonB family protein
MTDTLTIGLLPERRFNYHSLFAGFVLQGLLGLVLIQLGFIHPGKAEAVAEKMVHTSLVFKRAGAVPVASQLTLKAYVLPVVAKLTVPHDVPQPNVATPIDLPEVAAVTTPLPEISKPMAKLPPAPVQLGAFAPTTQKPTISKPIQASQVQTGGFGDPNGAKGQGDGKEKLQVAALGTFDMPGGQGHGNGTGGTRGIAGAVESSGFGALTNAPASSYSLQAVDNSDTPASAVEIVSKPKPAYTEEGRTLKIEGDVRLEVRFTAAGQAHVVKVIKGLGYGLDEQAVRAAEQIKFKPARHDGQSVDSTAVVHIIFELAS